MGDRLLARAGFLFLVLRYLLARVPHEGDAAGSFVYAKAAAGFRFIDLGILILVLVHLSALVCSRRRILRCPRALVLPGTLFLLCIAVAIGYGRLKGGTNLFFDWRGLALGIGLYVVWALWMRTDDELQHVVRLFAIYMAVRVALLFGLYLTGRGETLLGIAIPTFDGPALSAIVFAALLAFRNQERGTDSFPQSSSGWRWPRHRICSSAQLPAHLLGRACDWQHILILQQRRRLRNLAVVGDDGCAWRRLLWESLSPTGSRVSTYCRWTANSADNSDHVHDLQDAWDQVRQSPLRESGLEPAYPTWRIRNWKNESVMVHNAPIHVWLKYGLAGSICYLWFHLALLGWLYRRSKYSGAKDAEFLNVAFAYLAAQFVMTLGFAPWPYSELQLTTLLSFILAAAFPKHIQATAWNLGPGEVDCVIVASIIVRHHPSFNSGEFIQDAIWSVSQQQDVAVEHIVVDGALVGHTVAILQRHPQVRWTSEPDNGQSDAINKGFLRASGDLVGWLNADDYYLPGGLEAIARAAQEYPEADVIHGDCVFVDGNGRIVRSKVEHDFDPDILLYFGCYIPSTATFFRRRVIESGLLLDCEYRVCMDFEYFARLAHAGCKFHYVPRFVAAFRWHGNNISLSQAARRAEERRQVQLRFGARRHSDSTFEAAGRRASRRSECCAR